MSQVYSKSHYREKETKIINGEPVTYQDVCVYEFKLGDVEDPQLYAAQPLWEWQQSEAGKWVMENAEETPYWIKNLDYNSFGYQFKVMARFNGKNYTYWKLKWGLR